MELLIRRGKKKMNRLKRLVVYILFLSSWISLLNADLIKPTVTKPLKIKKSSQTKPAGTIPLPYPDLTVTDLFFASGEVRFRVKNIGRQSKKPGKINYQLTVQLLSQGGSVVSTNTYQSIAAITSLSKLAPGQTTPIDRVSGKRIPQHEWMRLTLCINKDHKLLETNYANNCTTKTSRQLLADLKVVDGRLILYKPKKKKGILRRIGEFIWDLRDGIQFDVSGVKDDYIVVYVRNNGQESVTNFQLSVGLNHPGGVSKTYTRTYHDVIAPGKTLRAYFYVDKDKKRYSSSTCCYVVAAVDPFNKIKESNESNNKKVLRVIKRDNIRDHRH